MSVAPSLQVANKCSSTLIHEIWLCAICRVSVFYIVYKVYYVSVDTTGELLSPVGWRFGLVVMRWP